MSGEDFSFYRTRCARTKRNQRLLRYAPLVLRNGASAYENEDENEKHYPTLDVQQYNL
jgi:hypothetical protein